MATRQEVVDQLETQLALIRTTSGYATNLGLHVFTWKAVPFTDAELDGIDIRDTTDEVLERDEAAETVTLELTVEIEVVAKGGRSSHDTVRSQFKDIYKAIGTDRTLGGKAVTTYRVNDAIVVDQDEDYVAGGLVTIRVIHVEAEME